MSQFLFQYLPTDFLSYFIGQNWHQLGPRELQKILGSILAGHIALSPKVGPANRMKGKLDIGKVPSTLLSAELSIARVGEAQTPGEASTGVRAWCSGLPPAARAGGSTAQRAWATGVGGLPGAGQPAVGGSASCLSHTHGASVH